MATSVVIESASPASRSFTVCTLIEAHKQTNLYLFATHILFLSNRAPASISLSLYTLPIDALDKTEKAATPSLPALDETSFTPTIKAQQSQNMPQPRWSNIRHHVH